MKVAFHGEQDILLNTYLIFLVLSKLSYRYDVLPLEQVANPYNTTTPYSLKLDDTKIWVVSPASDKIVKIGVGGELMSHTDAIYDNANLLQLSTLNKARECQVVTNSVCGVVKSLS